MTLVEFIGFLISIVAFFVIAFKRHHEEKKRRQNPEAYKEEMERKERELKRFLKSLQTHEKREEVNRQEEDEDEDEEEDDVPHVLKNLQLSQTPLRRDLNQEQRKREQYLKTERANKPLRIPQERNRPYEQYHRKVIAKSIFEVDKIREESQAGQTIRALRSPREMLIIKEIFGKPKALRKDWDDLS